MFSTRILIKIGLGSCTSAGAAHGAKEQYVPGGGEVVKLKKTEMLGRSGFFKTVSGTAERKYEAAFNSVFKKNVYADENCTLTINLNLFYRQVHPQAVSSAVLRTIAQTLYGPGSDAGFYPDADNDYKFVKPWTGAEWMKFIETVKAQAALWDGKFWLVPSDAFDSLVSETGSWTAKSGSVKFRPNVKCEFKLHIVPHPGMAHHIIDVVNLLPNQFFRSHEGLYDSDDALPRQRTKKDSLNNAINTTQPVIAHEIGHSLGLPHIGVSRGLGHCNLAVAMENLRMGKIMRSGSIPALFRGGSNSSVCYGEQASGGDIHNIMGSGDRFSTENARPWIDRIFEHLNLDAFNYARVLATKSTWTVAMTDTPPRKVG